MTVPLSGYEVAEHVKKQFPQAVVEATENTLVLQSESVRVVAQFLHDSPSLRFDYLACLSGVDYADYFEVVYHLVSIEHNHSLTAKARLEDRENPEVPSVTPVWQGADLQERETYDLMGINFPGHPNLKRLLLWEGFPGHPLRKDYYQVHRPDMGYTITGGRPEPELDEAARKIEQKPPRALPL